MWSAFILRTSCREILELSYLAAGTKVQKVPFKAIGMESIDPRIIAGIFFLALNRPCLKEF
jgi:hypothetical protein